ncbi:MAG TPA: DUF6259 domain-containing protein, partial [Planctomycetota bacterium]|nr:DUF6259 domain-containing protein [Planctomycetota bacterium]
DYYMDSTFAPLFDPATPGIPAATFDLDGVYLDAFPGIGPCYAEAGDSLHTHPVGGGHEIAEGIERFVNGLEEELEQYGKPAYLFAESASEVLLSELTGGGQYYWVNEPDAALNTLGYVPLFPAVYHAYMPFSVNRFQDVMTCATDTEHCVAPGAAFCSSPALAMFLSTCPPVDPAAIDIYVNDTAMHMSWLWATGHRLTWTHRDPIRGQLLGDGSPVPESLLGFGGFQGKFVPLIEMFENLFTLSTLLGNRDGLFEGVMTVPPQLTFDPDDLQNPLADGSVVPFQRTKVPPVYSFAFLEHDGDVVVTFANWTNESITFGVHMDPSWYGITFPPAASWKVIESKVAVETVKQDPLTNPSVWLSDAAKTLGPRSQEVIRFEKVTP